MATSLARARRAPADRSASGVGQCSVGGVPEPGSAGGVVVVPTGSAAGGVSSAGSAGVGSAGGACTAGSSAGAGGACVPPVTFGSTTGAASSAGAFTGGATTGVFAGRRLTCRRLVAVRSATGPVDGA